MAEATDKTPLDAAAVQKMIADAISPVTATLKTIGDNQKVIADTMAADAAKAKAAADKAAADKAAAGKDGAAGVGAADAKPLTAEDVNKLVGERLDAALKAQQTAQQTTAQRDAYIADKLKGVPKAYQSQLGSDPTKWAAEEQAIREGLKADLASLGVTAKDVSGGNPGGASGASASPAEQVARLKTAGLSDGEASFAANMKLPA